MTRSTSRKLSSGYRINEAMQQPARWFHFLLPALILLIFSRPATSAEVRQLEKIDIAKVWAGHPVNFAIKTVNDFQCVAYYDTTRKMIVASRLIGDTVWKYTPLSTTTGWDSHNYIEMAIDDSGYIHVSGNMHNAASLIYFRSKKPWNTDEFTSPGMVGSLESSVTYPVFIKGLGSQLIFQYRDGGSGSGNTIWNSYDLTAKKWKRLTSAGLFDGEGQVNAYQTSPVAGPDGCFHIIWMWRETPVANTNFHLSHVKSKDLISWETMAGTKLTMPVKQGTAGVVVDPVASGHGLINMDFWISWDTHDRAVCTYHRYDNGSISQIFNTRWENGAWKIYQTSSWTGFKWNLDLQGSLTHDVAAEPLTVDEAGNLVQNYVYRAGDKRQWQLDEATLRPTKDGIYTPPEAMRDLYKLESDFSGMQVNTMRDGEYYLKWETMPINQDNARAAGTYPSSSVLRLYRFSTATRTTLQSASSHTASAYRVNRCHDMMTIAPSSRNPAPFTAALFSIDGRLIARTPSGTRGNAVLRIPPQCGVSVLRVTTSNKTGMVEKVMRF